MPNLTRFAYQKGLFAIIGAEYILSVRKCSPNTSLLPETVLKYFYRKSSIVRAHMYKPHVATESFAFSGNKCRKSARVVFFSLQ